MLRIKTINYGGRPPRSTHPNEISFKYRSRVRPEQVYVGEHSFKRADLLDRIEITSNGATYRSYQLRYNRTSLGYQRLQSVQEYNGANKALSPIIFDYENTASRVEDRLSSTIHPRFDYKSHALIAGDYNGDGQTDVVFYSKNTRNKIYMHTDLSRSISLGYEIDSGRFDHIFSSTILSHNNKVLGSQAITTVSDMGASAQFQVRFRTFAIAAYGPVFQYDKIWHEAPTYRSDDRSGDATYAVPQKYLSGDFNGDGLTDVIAIEKPYTIISRCNNSVYNDRCQEDRVANNTVRFINLKRFQSTNFVSDSGRLVASIGAQDKLLTADHNGDGRQDIYHFTRGKLYIYTLDDNNRLKLLHTETDGSIKTNQLILLGDYNGDGKTDFIVPTAEKSQNWRYFMSKGKSFYKAIQRLPFGYYKDEYIEGSVFKSGIHINDPYYEYRYTAQDVNGDGKTDVILHNTVGPVTNKSNFNYRAQTEYVSLYKSTQSSTGTTPSMEYETGYETASGDVGEFGTPIFLETNRTHGNLEYGYISQNKTYLYKFTKDHKKDVTLKSITNHGVTTSIDYAPLDADSGDVYNKTRQVRDYPYVHINKGKRFLLVRRLTETGAGISRYQDFKYEGAVSNIQTGYFGFSKTLRSNWHGNGVSPLWTISAHDPSKKGAITQQWLSTIPYVSSSYLAKTTTTYTTTIDDRKIFTNLPTQVVQHNTLTGATTTTTYTYDAYQNPLTQRTTYNGGSQQVSYTYINSNKPTTGSWEYYIGRPASKTETSTIGSQSFTSEARYSYTRNLLSEQKVKGQDTPWNSERFIYDLSGNVTRKTLVADGLSPRTEHFKYDPSARFLIESTDIEGLKTQITYDVFGNPLSTTNPYGQTTSFAYDAWNRLISEDNYLGHTTTFTYKYLTGGGLQKTTDYPEGSDEQVEYNTFGWVTHSRVLSINNQWIQKSFLYDVAGRQLKESEPYRERPSQWNTTSYDLYGRVIAQASFNGLTNTITYKGLATTVTDGVKVRTTVQDGGGNTVRIESPDGNIHYTYYGNGVMKSTNYNDHKIYAEIDGWGHKTKLIDPSAGTYTYRYNSLGEVLEETSPQGTTSYTYDNLGKITSKNIQGTLTNMTLSYTYATDTKLLTAIQGTNARTNESYNYTYQYDDHQRPSTTKEQNGQAYFEHQVTRDDHGRVSAETYLSRSTPNNVESIVKVRNVYEANSGILTEIKDFNTNSSLWQLQRVNARGQSEEIHLGNGMVKRRDYDAYGFLTKIHDKTSGSSSQKALDIDYRFDTQRGNLLSRKNNPLNWEERFGYDRVDQLTTIAGSVARTQGYDGRGRIMTNSALGNYVYGGSHYHLRTAQLNTQGDLYYQNHPLQTITYNAYKKPVQIVAKGRAKVDFEYSILQHRSHAYYGNQADTKTERRYRKDYSGISPVEIVSDTDGNTKIITYLGGDAYTAPVVHIKQSNADATQGYHYVHRDYLGSILAISNSAGQVLEQRQFGAWGEVDRFKRGDSEIDFSPENTLLNRGYTGHEHFTGVALIHMNGRMYDAKLGRFLSPDNYIQDPTNPQGFNRFGYVLNNPLKFTDPSGEIFWLAVAAGALIGAYIGGATANNNNWNPFKWDYSSGATWGGIGLGALVGAVSGEVIAAGIKNVLAFGFFKVKLAASLAVPGLGTLGVVKIGNELSTEYTNPQGETYNSALKPLQAQIELALPANRALPNSLLRINTSGLSPFRIGRVQGNLPGLGAGGGTEFLFNQTIPASAIKIIR